MPAIALSAALLQVRRSLSAVLLLFFLTGLFCSVNAALTFSGPPSYRNDGLHFIKRHAAAIPFRSPGTEALLRALLTGDRSLLTKETVAIFRRSGASHILALSGLHLGIIYSVLAASCSVCGGSPAGRKLRLIIIVATCGLYSYASGMSPSVTRAFLFILIREVSLILHRKCTLVHLLGCTLLLQTALWPASAETIGFRLSYLAMAGIAFVFPFLRNLYPREDGGMFARADLTRKIYEAVVLSASCQAFTAPLVLYTFGTIPRYFIITNLIALPLTSALMYSAIAAITLSAIGICPDALVAVTDHLADALTESLGIIADM